MEWLKLYFLRRSIKRYGILRPCIVGDGVLLDGWHRAKIAEELGIDLPVFEVSGEEKEVDPKTLL